MRSEAVESERIGERKRGRAEEPDQRTREQDGNGAAREPEEYRASYGSGETQRQDPFASERAVGEVAPHRPRCEPDAGHQCERCPDRLCIEAAIAKEERQERDEGRLGEADEAEEEAHAQQRVVVRRHRGERSQGRS